MKPHDSNNDMDFIAGWYMDDTTLCDDIIEYYKDHPKLGYTPVVFTNDGWVPVDKNIKESIDAGFELFSEELRDRYVIHLQQCLVNYCGLYEYANLVERFSVVENPNFQHYNPPTGGYKQWHAEVNGKNNANRHLVFMTYLNDVEEGGGTEFFYQNKTIKAEKGLTLIWAAHWTHTHRGIVAPNEDKYIITGWFSYD
jgi:prolyl 4-hydroxylase